MGFGFQLSILLHMAVSDADACAAHEVRGLPFTVTMSAAPWDDIHKQRIEFSAKGFPDKAAATSSAEELWQYILVGCAASRVGVIRRDLHILSPGQLGPVTLQAHAQISERTEQFATRIIRGYTLAPKLTDRQRIAAGLISDSLLVANVDAQFIMRISAVEALCEQGKLSTADASCLAAIVEATEKSGLSDPVRLALVQTIKNTKGGSVGAAYRKKIGDLLGQDKLTEFKPLYNKRSELVHEGQHRGELGRECELALKIAIDLLAADIAQNNKTAGYDESSVN